MSDMVNNETLRQEERKAALKGVILSLHAGRTVDEVKSEFAALLRDVGAGEIAEIEQALIAGGVTGAEIKRLCDVHVAVFRDALDDQPEPGARPGHPTETLQAENAAAECAIVALEQAVAASDWEQAQGRLDTLREYQKHYVREENILFPYLEKHGFTGPSSVMWAIHDDVRAGWKALDALLAAGPGEDEAAFRAQLEATMEPLNTTIRDMFSKEERILIPAALERLSSEEWQAIREQGPEVGYFQVEPDTYQAPEQEGAQVAEVRGPAPEEVDQRDRGLIQLDTGAMSTEEINLVLTHMPLDFTFVDADDRVRYFSGGEERIFPRSPAIIGRTVQRCHPPASVHRVQEVLDDFRDGRQDTAAFWIQMQGRFIHIRYFALRDRDGQYRGTLEVSQDVTAIRELEGEKRLVGENGGDG